MVRLQEQVQLSLRLEVPAEVVARTRFEVRVFSEPEVPAGATVTVTVVFDGTESAAMDLTPGARSAVFSVTAPDRLAEGLELITTSAVTVAESDVLQVTVMDASTEVDVVAQSVQLTLMVMPETVNIGGEVEVTAGVSPALLADTTLTVAVFFGASSQQVTLTDRASSQELTFTASTLGLLEVSARAVDVEPEGLVIAASATETVEVLAAGVVVLTLAAPDRVTVGDTITVTVGVAAGTPLTAGMTVTATISFAAGTADSDEQGVMLTFGASTATERFTAPIRAGTVRVAVSGEVSGGMVRGASASVTVEPVAVTLTLRRPATAVSVGETYQVTVDTSRTVPQGTTLEVTVSAGTEMRVLLLTADFSEDVMFTAPAGTDQVTVMATAVPQTAPDALEVAVLDAQPLTVFIFTPALSLQPEGMLTRMEHAVFTEAYFNAPEFPGLIGLQRFAVSGDLLFVTSQILTAGVAPLSVWRVNAEAGTLSRIVDGDNMISGLNGVAGIAVSGDLLFVNELVDDALSVWRVNRASGTLRQTARYTDGGLDDGDNTISGLDGPEAAAVSGELLFVAASSLVTTDVLSVWRVNESSGTLVQTAVYLDGDFGGLDRVLDMAVSDNLLFVISFDDNALSAWRINAEAGTLSRTDLHRDVQNNIDGLDGPRGVAVSGDLLFVTARRDDALSVWRINAEEGTLSQVEVYRDGVNGIDGLEAAQDVAASGDLLFVVAREGTDILSTMSALSIWRINAEAGTLVQNELYRDGEGAIDGLGGVSRVAVSGDVLFASAEQNIGTITVWHINNAELPFGEPLTVRAQSDMPVLREVEVTVTARNGADTAATVVTLSPENLSAEAIFAADDLVPGRWIFTAEAEPSTLLDTSAARIAVQVLAPVQLTLDVPPSVTVGDTLTVTVGVAAETPLPEGVSVTATLSFSADGVDDRVVTLTSGAPTATASFTAPVTAGVFRVEVSGRAVIGTSASVTVEPVAVMLQLSGPDTVTVGQTYQVMVDTNMPVPAGTTLEVTVRADAEEREQVQVVFLAGDIPGQATFTAPASMDQVTVTAMATTVQTAPGARQVAVSAADTLTVTVSALDVQLVLSELPLAPVAVGSTFPVTVATVPALPEGAAVTVTLSLADLPGVGVELRPGASTQSVAVTAPDEVGPALLLAEGVAAADSVQLNVLAVTATVQVAELAARNLVLLVPPDPVEAGSTFSVTVRTNEPVPEGATVSVMVTFEGSTQTETLSASTPEASVMFTAPGSPTGTYTVNATGAPSVTDANVLQLMVDPTSTSVEVVPVAIALTLTPTSIVVRANAMFSVEVGTDRNLPAGTVVNVELQFNRVAMPSTLSAADSTASLDFTAPSEGSLSLVASVTNITQSSPVVAVSVPAPVLVQVTELVTLGLILDAPTAAVEAGSTFSVTVRTNEPVPEGAIVSVMVTFEGSTQAAILSASTATASVVFTAPGSPTGTYTVNATGAPIVTDENVLQLTVNPTSASVEVVPMAITLQLTAPVVVDGNSTFAATVNTDRLLPAGTVVALIVQFGEATRTVTLSSGTTPAASVEFTAPPRGLLELTAEVSEITQSSPVVAVSVPAPVRVQVTELVTLRLILDAPADVEVGSAFSVMVETDEPVPPGEEVSLMVTFDGSVQTGTLSASTATATVMFTAPSTRIGTFEVDAVGMPTATNPNALRLTVPPVSISVEVVPQSVQLMLTTLAVVNENVEFPVTVSVFPALLAGITLTVEVTFGEASSEQVTLSATTSSQELRFTASAPGPLTVSARQIAVEPVGLVVAASATETVEVLAAGVVVLTLDAPANVTVGDTITVTVGVAAGTPLTMGTTVTATVSFAAGTADSDEQEVMLTFGASTATERFTAPIRAGTVRVAVSGEVSDGTVRGASASVTVEPVAVTLTLRGPAVAVSVGETYQVTVGTSRPVPQGTTLEVTVRAGTDMREVVLTADFSEDVMFTAPASTDQVTVMATAVPQTAPDALEVAVLDAQPLTVFIFTPALSLQPEGMLTRMEHAVFTEAYFNSPGSSVFLFGQKRFAVSGDGDLLFVRGRFQTGTNLSVWRVNAEAGTLSQTVVYQNGDRDDGGNTISGLNGVEGVAVSGNLLFVTAFEGNALSVWRVNQTSGTLRQTALYRNGDRDDGGNQVSGLSGAAAVAVSGDLLFVTSINNNALSVWRVNESSGTLRQTAVYLDSDFDGLDRALNMAVSDNLLFVSAIDDNALSAWRINAEAGTLSRTDLHRDDANVIDGLGSPRGIAVRGDLLFVTAQFDDALSVWRINAEEGTLSQAEIYLDGVNGIDGLDGPRGIAVRGDLLFVATRDGNGALSIWRINAEAETGILRQTALHRDGVLFGASEVGVSGDVLFVSADSAGGSISVWHINNAELPFGEPLTVRVQSDTPVLREVEVTVTARNGAEMARDTVSLSPENLSAEAIFAADDLVPGRWIFTAEAEPSTLLDTSAARIAVQVLAPVQLTLDVPDRVTVGDMFAVTVGVAAETPLPGGASVTATLSIAGGDDDRVVTLTSEMPSAMQRFTAPVTAGVFRAEVSGEVSAGTVLGASASVTVEPVAVMLQLSGPDTVTVGQTYQVMVDTVVPVPAGITLGVTVRISTESQEPQVVFLAGDSSGVATFTAPPRANEVVVVTAMATTVQTAPGARQVAVSAADTLTVTVSALAVQLVLSELPLQPVAIGSTFPVTVATVPALPEGAVVAVTLSLADLSEVEVELRPGASTQSVAVTAPNEAGSVPLLAEGAAAASSVLELNVLAATATVQVQEQVLLSLQLEALDRVAASSTFSVTVRTNEPVPEGATVSVMVTFDGSTQTETLSAGETMATVMFTAPGTTTGIFTVDATGAPSVTDANLLQLTVNPTSTSVEVVPVAIALTLTPTSIVVSANAMFAVQVDTDRGLPADTEVALMVQFDGASRTVTLSATTPTANVGFTAPSEGSLSLVASVTNITQSSPVVAVSMPAPVLVQVTELVTLGLMLSTPSVAVAAGSTFSVTVETDEPVPEGAQVSVMVTFEGSTLTETLSAGETTATVIFTAPGSPTGTYTVNATGAPIVTDENVLQLMVDPVSAEVEVVPVDIMLQLADPGVVDGNSTFAVTVNTDRVLPAGTVVALIVQFGEATRTVTLSGGTMPTDSVEFTAPPRGLLELSALVAEITQSSPVVAVSAPVPVRVQVTARVTLGLTLSTPSVAVAAGSTFSVTVETDEPVPEGATVTVMVTFAGSTQTETLSASAPAASVVFTAPGSPTGTYTVNATGAPSVTDETVLQLTVNPTSTSVEVVPVAITLQLADPGVVEGSSTFTAMVDTDRVLPAGTVVELIVQFGSASMPAVLSAMTPTASVEFTAPLSGVVELTAEVSRITQSSPVVTVFVPAPVRVQVTELVTLRLILDAPERVEVGSAFSVTVETDEPVPPGEEVSLMVTFEGSVQTGTLSASTATATVMFTAPSTRIGTFEVDAAGTSSAINPNALRLTVTPASISVEVVPQSVQLMLTTLAVVNENVEFPVTVSVFPALLAGITLTVEVTFGEASSEQVTLSATTPSQELRFTASAAGPLEVSARAVDVEPEGLVIAASATETVEVLAAGIVALTLDAPDRVTVGDTITVTVGVDDGTPLTAGTTVTATVSFAAGTADSDEQEVMLTFGASTATERFTAPIRAGTVRVAVSGGTVRGASASVTVEPVAVAVELSAPAAVTVGETYQVTVGTIMPVPEGTTLTVTVSAGTETREVLLIGSDFSEDVMFTAPASTDELTVTAMVMTQTAPDALEVAVLDAQPLTVFIFTPALSLQLEGMLTRMEHAVPTDLHLNAAAEIDGLQGARGVAASGDLLFVTGFDDNALSVWRVNAEAGTLRQTVVYRDDEGGIDGLAGAWEVVVSASGNLLFVTGFIDDALSVWRVNAEAGTLSQTALYQDSGVLDTDENYIAEVDGRMDGLNGAAGAVVSGDLLFVAGFRDSAISVWQVNESSGTLRQTGFHHADELFGAEGVAVSGDLLFVTGSASSYLSVWRVNESSGTLRQTAVYRNGMAGIRGLDTPQSVAVSGDLLFVTGFGDNALSVWQINAEAGTLRQTVVYQEGDRDGDSEIGGLVGAQDVAVSGDLLFVTGFSGNALSIWRVNAEAGTLRQIEVYQDDENEIDGLGGAQDVAVSGDLLFVTGQVDQALSAWRINNAEVFFGAPLIIRAQSDMAVTREVVVTVTARNGADTASRSGYPFSRKPVCGGNICRGRLGARAVDFHGRGRAFNFAGYQCRSHCRAGAGPR